MGTPGVRRAGACAAGAGAAWLAVWAHQAVAHGTTQLNEEDVVLGLTWMDAGKFLVIPFALLYPVMEELGARGHPLGRLGRGGSVVARAALVALVVGVALEFWSFPWGSYAEAFDEPLPTYGGVVQILGSLALTAGSVLLAAELGRRRVLPYWLGVVLVAGAATTFYLTPVLPVPGIAWLVLGAYLLRASRSEARR